MTNEPTTGEIVRELREVVSDPMFRIHEIAKRCRIAADRLESQERTIAELTARAESAERERDSAVDAIADIKENGFCGSCKGCNAPYVGQEKITFCYGWEWRGLQPQEGERK